MGEKDVAVSTHLDLVQGSAQLRAAFPALAPDAEHASLLWRRRCRACEKVTHAMAAVPPTSGAPARAALKSFVLSVHGLRRGQSYANHAPHIPGCLTSLIYAVKAICCVYQMIRLDCYRIRHAHTVLRLCSMFPVQTMTAELKHMGAAGGACASGGQPGGVPLPHMLCRLQVMHTSRQMCILPSVQNLGCADP